MIGKLIVFLSPSVLAWVLICLSSFAGFEEGESISVAQQCFLGGWQTGTGKIWLPIFKANETRSPLSYQEMESSRTRINRSTPTLAPQKPWIGRPGSCSGAGSFNMLYYIYIYIRCFCFEPSLQNQKPSLPSTPTSIPRDPIALYPHLGVCAEGLQVFVDRLNGLRFIAVLSLRSSVLRGPPVCLLVRWSYRSCLLATAFLSSAFTDSVRTPR